MTEPTATPLERILSWARANSLWTYSISTGCCADEVLGVTGCRYDLERFGCVPQVESRHADLLIINGLINQQSAPEVKAVYDQMRAPKYVMAVGACACRGGAFGKGLSYSALPGIESIVPVDVFVPGCPPRPEAIMDGLITLQEKINGIR